MAKRANGEGSIYFQKSRGRYAGVVTLDSGKRQVYYGKTREEVGKKLTAALATVHQGLPLPGGKLSLGQYLEDWLEQAARPKVKPRPSAVTSSSCASTSNQRSVNTR